ncbi:MAG: TetR/AcrR family transcriptional regulator [Anaerolineaceae bacterium]
MKILIPFTSFSNRRKMHPHSAEAIHNTQTSLIAKNEGKKMLTQKPLDRRIIRTKLAIHEAFVFLIKRKGFDAMLVSDIAEQANINRGTFYLHYQDKFDLLEKTQTEIIANVERIILQANTLDLSAFNSVEKPLPVIISVFEYLKENAEAHACHV